MPTHKLIHPEAVLEASVRIAKLIHTPDILVKTELDYKFNCQLFIQCENQQVTGSFKYRGASNAIVGLLEQGSLSGVCTHSSGNHGKALARAARLQGIPAGIVIPDNALPAKIAAIKAEGAHIHLCQPNQQARETGMQKLVDSGLTAIPPYDHPLVIPGQGTWALDLNKHLQDLDILLVPIGGGGLAAGTILARDLLAKTGAAKPLVIGAEPEQADDCWRSLQQGQRVTEHHPDTIADGLRAKIGKLTFPLIKSGINVVLRVSESEILAAQKLCEETLHQQIEPSSATIIAALQRYPDLFKGRKVGTLFTGGNAS